MAALNLLGLLRAPDLVIIYLCRAGFTFRYPCPHPAKTAGLHIALLKVPLLFWLLVFQAPFHFTLVLEVYPGPQCLLSSNFTCVIKISREVDAGSAKGATQSDVQGSKTCNCMPASLTPRSIWERRRGENNDRVSQCSTKRTFFLEKLLFFGRLWPREGGMWEPFLALLLVLNFLVVYVFSLRNQYVFTNSSVQGSC